MGFESRAWCNFNLSHFYLMEYRFEVVLSPDLPLADLQYASIGKRQAGVGIRKVATATVFSVALSAS
jgi:hypothetical protein